MLFFVLRRFLSALPTMAVLITAAFFMIRLAPGGPFDKQRTIPPAIMKNLLAHYGFDQPLWRQYLDYVGGLFRGDLGPSFRHLDVTVAELIATGFPASLRLGGTAILLAFLAGTTLGLLAALRQNRAGDHAVMAVAMTGIAVPNFVMAPILQLLLGVYLGLLPVAGWSGGALKNLVLPVTALALPQIAYIARMTRGSMIEVLNQNYIRTARAKGLRERLVLLRHALRGALLPVVSYLGPAAAALITGSVVIETIFDLPGIGRYFILGALDRDYTLVMGVMVFYAGLIMLFNLIVDLLYAVLDPKVRLE